MKSLLYLCMLLFMPVVVFSEEKPGLPDTEIAVTAGDGTELSLYQYPAQGQYLLLWVGSGYGFSDRTILTARNFADRGIEVWKIDFAEAMFQTSSSNFIRNLNAGYVADIIEAAHRKTGKKILLFARAYGAVPVLRGATLWQQRKTRHANLIGAILLSPDLYAAIPSLGQDPDYLPITKATTIPLFILQAGQRGTAWKLPDLLTNLSNSNPNVYFSVMWGVSSIFYQNDLNPETLSKLESLPTELPGIIKLLETTHYEKSHLGYIQPETQSRARLDSKLKPFKGNTTPPSITLEDINGKSFMIDNYSGQITIVNFWATWCPPCVEEIPSLNRLRQKMSAKPFRLISINYAEQPQTVRNFMKQVNVEFPVLMDESGKVSAQWNIIAFPSTFVIGPDGKIHYGVNAAIRWDAPEIIQTLNSLYQ